MISASKEANVEFRIMPSVDRGWYWEVVRDGDNVIIRGVADDEPTACQEASDAAREANLIPQRSPG